MKLRKFIKSIGVVALSLTMIVEVKTPVNAFTSDQSGYLGKKGLTYDYSSSGVLTIKGDSSLGEFNKLVLGIGTSSSDDSQDTRLYLDNSFTQVSNLNFSDVKTLVIKDIDTLCKDSSYMVLSQLPNVESVIFEGDIKSISHFFSTSLSLRYLEIPSTVTELGSSVLEVWDNTTQVKLKIPSSVTNIADDMIHCYNGGGYKAKTIVCEKGSAAYEYAAQKGCIIELYDSSVECEATLNNDITWGIVTPEDITFAYSSDGWIADTWVGITGDLSQSSTLTVTTDDNFDILGDTKTDIQNVEVTSDDGNTSTSAGSIITTLNNSKLQAGKVNVDTIGAVYKIPYKCKTTSSSLLRQKYIGTVKFIVNEKMS